MKCSTIFLFCLMNTSLLLKSRRRNRLRLMASSICLNIEYFCAKSKSHISGSATPWPEPWWIGTGTYQEDDRDALAAARDQPAGEQDQGRAGGQVEKGASQLETVQHHHHHPDRKNRVLSISVVEPFHYFHLIIYWGLFYSQKERVLCFGLPVLNLKGWQSNLLHEPWRLFKILFYFFSLNTGQSWSF